MPFLGENIDRAIVMTQYDLRGFDHPFGYREEKLQSAKSLYAITYNLAAFAAGDLSNNEDYVSGSSSFEHYLLMCKNLAEACEGSRKEAIQLIIKEIVVQSEEMKAEVEAGTRKPSSYLKSLSRDNSWGKVVLALAEAFDVPLEEVASEQVET